MRDKILICGGYGQVGRVIATRLGERLPGRVVVAGRNQERAAALAQAAQGRLIPRGLDLADEAGWGSALHDASLAIVCLEQNNAAFARACLERGTHVIDISASDHILQQIEALDALARQRGASAVLSVGLAPGLTNLLARYLSDLLDTAETVDICVLLGLGEAHGTDAVRWMLEHAVKPFSVQTPQGRRDVRSLSEPRVFALPPPYGQRRAYRFNFSDQHVLPRTLGGAAVATRLCYDSAVVTDLFAALGRLGVLPRIARLDPSQLARVMRWLPMGGDGYVVQVEVLGSRSGRRQICTASAQGRGEAHATGVVTALVAEHVLSGAAPHGVYHSEQICKPARLLRQLRQEQIDIVLTVRPVLEDSL